MSSYDEFNGSLKFVINNRRSWAYIVYKYMRFV